ncbi:ATP-binding cassette domain-containing protein [Arachidicoccus ginsenosidivorans]|jgi:ABC-2 type transport system ATP-binding protein|uniref:ATP-binding cassette domain-containing protein n=1 Tax=Arachidicoccus ginsenosidivorans TaxID=496057 RepID=A0A5B8VL04_9BACT|nr:ATP-binding cassette domain-containing protein [Arachidicoccus ginsenosidivorans]QEC72190.1 ATP-binding cassette domain-containing protein [Arachidicoccus ginsenosidivorans]
MSTTVLSIQHLSKSYGALQALSDVSFEVPKGSIYGVLGPNGSGKTTMLGIITDVLRPDSGQYTLLNSPDHEQARKKTGTLLETPNFYPYLSAYKNLEISALIKGVSTMEIDPVLERVGLLARKNSKFSTFSLGMKQRLAIGAALLGNPELLILDEPTNGLDPNGIAEIRNLIKGLAVEGRTVVMASHLLDEVEKVCTHVAIIKNGKLLTSGSVGEVLASEDVIALRSVDLKKLSDILPGIAGFSKLEWQNEQILLHADLGRSSLEAINQYCFENGVILTHLALQRASLEARFLEITH